MAFETYLTHDKAKPKKSRRITYALSLGVHGLLLAIGVAGSYASVEELAPKIAFVPITFSVPPPPSALGSDKPKTEARKTKTPSKVRQPSKISQPIAQPTQEQSKGSDDLPPGNPDGDPNVISDGGGDGPPQDVFIPPHVSRGQLAIDPQSERHRARLPAALARAGMTVSVLMKICVDRNGEVESVKVLKSDDATAEPNVVGAVRTWRYTPYKVDGRPVPFCTTVKYVLNSN